MANTRNEVDWTLTAPRTIKLSARTSFGWKHSESVRAEVRRDCQNLAASLGGTIAVLNASGGELAHIGVHGEELPGTIGAAHVDGERVPRLTLVKR